MSENSVRRFLFEDLDIRGALVRLGTSWRQMVVGRNYAEPVARLLGEMSAVTALIAGQLKQKGRLTIQLRGSGPIRLLVIDCNENLQIRGMARAATELPNGLTTPTLLGAAQDGQLVLTLDLPQGREPYQSIVPIVGDTIASIFEHYLEKSEQQPSRLFLAADQRHCACLFLQKTPETDQHDPDGWNRITQLAATVQESELLRLPAETLLGRLFSDDVLRLYDPRQVTYHCPEDREKIRDMLRSLGRNEVQHLLDEHGEIVVQDEICHREYRFTQDEIAALFSSTSLH